MRCSCPSLDVFKSAIINGGYRVSGQHKEPQAIKTDAPNRFIWDIMRSWIKENPINEKNRKDIIEKILSIEPRYNIDFTVSEEISIRKKATRFPMNPEKNWGPKHRAVGRRESLKVR